jgi:hypothetical protein
MADQGNKDLNELIIDIMKRMDKINRCNGGGNNSSSTALVPVPNGGSACGDNTSYGGDPRNSYREMRRYLLTIGIDTRIFTFSTIPLPVAINESRKSLPSITLDLGTLDNCFHFELRKIIEPGVRGEKVNSQVLLVRVFFEGVQQANTVTFWVQIVLNHHREAVMELNRIYNKIIPTLTSAGWSQPTVGREGCRVTYFEKRFVDVSDFKHEFTDLYDGFRADGITGSYLAQVGGCFSPTICFHR